MNNGWYETLENVKNQLAWLEYVPEEELTEAEASRIRKSGERFLRVIKKLNRKYVD